MPARRAKAMLYALAAACARRISAQRITQPGVGGSSQNAYFVMVGPLEPQRAYHPWLVSAVSMANTLRDHGSTSDFVLLLATKRDGRPRETVDLLEEEEATLLKSKCRWRYAQPPGKKHLAGYHMGHYKLLAWQHIEYRTIQLLDADLLPVNNLDPLFSLTKAFDTEVVACPGKVAPLNAGWVLMRPSLSTYEGLLKTLDVMKRTNRDAPYGHAMTTPWRAATGAAGGSDWRFFDVFGNQGHMYDYFRFEAHSLAIITQSTQNGTRVFAYGVDERIVDELPSVLDEAFPCPFPVRGKRAPAGLAYHHFTGSRKPWRPFTPSNAKYRAWYAAASRRGADLGILEGLFPSVPRDVLLEVATRGL